MKHRQNAKILSMNKNDADAINLMGSIAEKQRFYDRPKITF